MNFANALREGDMIALKILEKTNLHNHVDSIGGDKNKWRVGPKRIIEAINKAKNDGITIWAPSFSNRLKRSFSSYEQGIKCFEQELSKSETNIRLYPGLVIRRGCTAYEAEQMLEEAVQTGWLRTIDIICDKAISADVYVNLYKKAAEYGLVRRAHVDKCADSRVVKGYIEWLNLDEISHGIAIAESEYLMSLAKERGIYMHICPASDIREGYCDGYSSYPIRKLYEKGINLTLSVDNYTLYNEMVTGEYYNLYQAGVLGADELEQIRMCGIELERKYFLRTCV